MASESANASGTPRSLQKQHTFVDLFCGCGGFTLGLLRAGLRCLAAVDLEPSAISTLESNLGKAATSALPRVEHSLVRDLTKMSPQQLGAIIGTDSVDLVVGGPPCQGFSTARQVDGANHGARLTEDPRRSLYKYFLKYVDHFKPLIFVMENVPGIRTAAGGEYFSLVQNEARRLGNKPDGRGYRVHSQVENAWLLGVPQKRRRQLIIGVRSDLNDYFFSNIPAAPRATPQIFLGAAIGDLPILRAGGGKHERDYDLARRARHLSSLGEEARNYLFKVLEVGSTELLTGHVARPHSERDLRDFARLREGESSAVAMRKRNITFEFPYDKSNFKDRYTRLSRSKPSNTIVAHLSKDGLMFIHPTQKRSLTPREAARLQSFPDWFRFPEARTQAFQQIGNAVPPLVAEALGLAIVAFLANQPSTQHSLTKPQEGSQLFQARVEQQNGMREELEAIAALRPRALKSLSKQEFLKGWRTLLSLLPELHPENYTDHGTDTELWHQASSVMPQLEKVRQRRYVRSGWPVALEPIGREAFRRYKARQISQREMYGL
jgi:DNA (cytosine-5)-methyltransferase 1